MRRGLTLMEPPDLTPEETHVIRLTVGPGWDDDLDFILRAPTGTPMGWVKASDPPYEVQVPGGYNVLYLFYHA